jgi:PelA/Pel-15E family pectate lyase
MNFATGLRLPFVVIASSLLTSLLAAGPAVTSIPQAPTADRVPLADPRATKLTDLAYGQAGGETLLLDASVPAGSGPFPVAILVHGGGWTAGDKSGADTHGSGADITPWFAPLTDGKFTWFSINYRLAPKHRWPAPLDDVLAAIRWVKAHAVEYKGDPSRIVLVGHSAGGHLASLAATVVDDSVRVQAVVGYAPVTTFEQEMLARGELGRAQQGLLNRPRDLTPESLGQLRAISPLNHVRPGLPPFLLLHGDADTSVPLQQSLDFQEALRASAVRCDLIVLPGAPHRLTEWARFMPDHAVRTIAWLREVLGAPIAATGAVPQSSWDSGVLRHAPDWYGSAEARAVADSVIQYQSRQGGWPKSTDLAAPPRSPQDIPSPGDGRANTIDNDATTLPMQFLALMVQATGDARYRASFERGVDYLLAAQYPNGGWPQFFPLRDGYYSRITYNDNAMVNVLTVLRDAAAGKPPYAFVDAERRARAGAAVARGIEVILRTQVKHGGRLTAWCAQHDEWTLEPAWARNYEPPTLSGNESVGIVRFLMDIDRPTPEIVAAIEGAVVWLKNVTINGLRLEEFTAADGMRDRRVVPDPAGSPLWARFYALGTNRPVFTGRDKVMRDSLSEIEHERRNGYAYYGTWPARLLAVEYARWRTRHKLEAAADAASVRMPQPPHWGD